MIGNLFIGGSNDGKRFCQEAPVVRAYSRDKDGQVVSQTHRREIIEGRDFRFTFYVLDSMPLDEAIMLLLENYQGKA